VIFNVRPRTRATVSSLWFSYITDCKDTALLCALLLRSRKTERRKQLWALR